MVMTASEAIAKWSVDDAGVLRRISDGKRAGPYVNSGVMMVRIKCPDKMSTSAHRIAWLMHYGEWPEGGVRHKNGMNMDNRMVNLELV